MNLVLEFTKSPNNVYIQELLPFVFDIFPPNVFVVQHFPENVSTVLLAN